MSQTITLTVIPGTKVLYNKRYLMTKEWILGYPVYHKDNRGAKTVLQSFILKCEKKTKKKKKLLMYHEKY